MKKIHLIPLFCFVALLLQLETRAQEGVRKPDTKKAVTGDLPVQDTNSYIFYPETAFPLTEGPKMLSSGYDLRFSSGKLSCYLPYFGTPETVNYGMNDGNVELNTTKFTYTAAKNDKKGEHTISLKPAEQKDIRELNITVYDNGSAYVRVSFQNRQNISYRGKLAKAKSSQTEAFAK